ncbi:hypothetical protein ACIQ1D_19285 [Lysinibacillus xylanilyticus]|uniref:hypothetical protein n=1 Tax=Lysinibacillus xylanilyticus TaxID=582475 RepID=UPI0038049A33
MKLVVDKKLVNNAYEVMLEIQDITPEDKEQIHDFGEQTFNIGGKLTEIKDVVKETGFIEKPKVEVVKVPKTEMKEVEVTNPETQEVTKEMQEVPVLDAEGKQVIEDVTKPVLDEKGQPVMVKTPTYETVQEEVLVADLGNIYRKFPSEFPIKRTFTALEFGDKAEKVALGYVGLIQKEAERIVTELGKKVDSFTGSTEIQL